MSDADSATEENAETIAIDAIEMMQEYIKSCDKPFSMKDHSYIVSIMLAACATYSLVLNFDVSQLHDRLDELHKTISKQENI